MARVLTMALANADAADIRSTNHLEAIRVPRSTSDEGRGIVCLLVGRIYQINGLAEPTSSEPANVERLIAAAYRQRGSQVLEAISGHFVLVLWDEEGQRGLLAQDQVGGRSLYYHESDGRLCFASDVRPLLKLLPSRRPPDEVSLIHQIAFSDPPIQSTAYEGVSRLGAGHVLELGSKGWRRHCYWQPQYGPVRKVSRTELQEQLWHVVSNAVRARMRDADALGIIMSGGVDSTTVATAAMEGARDGLAIPRGYSAVFPDRPALDESDRINVLARSIGLESVQIEPWPGGIVPLMLDYMQTWDVPLTGPGYILERPLLEHAASDGVTVLLDGQGGDEVFGLSPYLLADRVRAGRIVSSWRLARQYPFALRNAPLKWSWAIWRLFGLKEALPNRVYDMRRGSRGRHVPAYLTPAAARLFRETESQVDWRRNRAGPLWWAFKAYLLTKAREKAYLPEYLRHRAAMAGIEARPPLLDLDLTKLALSYPPELDFDVRHDRPNIRGALRGRAPDAVRLDRRKSNLGSFYHAGWIGRDLPLVRRLLSGRDVEVRRYVRSGAIEELLASPPPVGGPRFMAFGKRVWGLLVAECFLQYQKDAGFADRLLSFPELAAPGFRVVRAPARAVA
jgi:asparagine synthase (glutamine-hydrolysing)